MGDARYWLEHGTYAPDELAVRFHHRRVLIHPFANGNGSHTRLMVDVLAQRRERPVFSWGGENLARAGDFRRHYIDALQTADAGDIGPLLTFARS
jgi:Fic-DOC domain mobile mystery protein B